MFTHSFNHSRVKWNIYHVPVPVLETGDKKTVFVLKKLTIQLGRGDKQTPTCADYYIIVNNVLWKQRRE